MSSEDEEVQNLSPAEAFRRAKVEHFLDRAQECLQMGKYLSAIRNLDSVFMLEKENLPAKEMRSAADEVLAQIQHRKTNGDPHRPGEEGAPGRLRRNDVVLVVDQDERLLTSLATTLRRYGFLAISASSYEDAIETFALAKPDVVISEVNFESGPRGFDLYLWLKTNFNHEAVPFLFLATRIDHDTIIAGKRFGVDDLIVKPVDDDVVIASIINCLARRKTTGTRA